MINTWNFMDVEILYRERDKNRFKISYDTHSELYWIEFSDAPGLNMKRFSFEDLCRTNPRDLEQKLKIDFPTIELILEKTNISFEEISFGIYQAKIKELEAYAKYLSRNQKI